MALKVPLLTNTANFPAAASHQRRLGGDDNGESRVDGTLSVRRGWHVVVKVVVDGSGIWRNIESTCKVAFKFSPRCQVFWT